MLAIPCLVPCLFRVTQDDIPAVQYDRTTHKLTLRHAIYIPGSSASAGHTPPYLPTYYKLGRACDQDCEISLSSLPSIMSRDMQAFYEMSDCSLTLAGIKPSYCFRQIIVVANNCPPTSSSNLDVAGPGLMMWHVEKKSNKDRRPRLLDHLPTSEAPTLDFRDGCSFKHDAHVLVHRRGMILCTDSVVSWRQVQGQHNPPC
ncbi:hypothetical protein F4810DRAFT_212176 [Camillea tinctor]|nr:hypothetical protein F4810DRAFT_212176 [Camillea tinctor]